MNEIAFADEVDNLTRIIERQIIILAMVEGKMSLTQIGKCRRILSPHLSGISDFSHRLEILPHPSPPKGRGIAVSVMELNTFLGAALRREGAPLTERLAPITYLIAGYVHLNSRRDNSVVLINWSEMRD